MTKAGTFTTITGIVTCKNDPATDGIGGCCGFHYVMKGPWGRERCTRYVDKHFLGGTNAAKVLYGFTSK